MFGRAGLRMALKNKIKTLDKCKKTNSIKYNQVLPSSIKYGQIISNTLKAMVNKIYYTTQEVAEKLGISKQTLFRYENKGIFPKPERHPINGWRQYADIDIKKLRDILNGNR